MGGPSGVLDLTSPSPTPPVATPTAAPRILAVPRLNIPQVEMHMRRTPYERKAKSQAIKANQAYVAIPARKVNKRKRDVSEEGEEEGESEKEPNASSPPPTRGRGHPRKESECSFSFLFFYLFIKVGFYQKNRLYFLPPVLAIKTVFVSPFSSYCISHVLTKRHLTNAPSSMLRGHRRYPRIRRSHSDTFCK